MDSEKINAKMKKSLQKVLEEKRKRLVENFGVVTEKIPEKIAERILPLESELEVDEVVLINHQNQNIEKIDSALERLNRGHYGYCVDCGGTIPLKRLMVCPEATMCVDCQSELEDKFKAS